MHPDAARVLLSEDTIRAKVRELGQQITRDYAGKEIVLVGILKGAVLFLSDLARAIELPASLDFMSVSSYGHSTKSSGIVRIIKDLDESIEGKHVIVVEDIVDTGLTLNYLKETLAGRDPASLKICALLDKESRRQVPVKVDYVGFPIPDEFVVGYGLDFAGKYRNHPEIFILKPEAYGQQA
ncbi:MAG: hypoxanthine phosphoribosyltransferase [Chloroflexota bacterium]